MGPIKGKTQHNTNRSLCQAATETDHGMRLSPPKKHSHRSHKVFKQQFPQMFMCIVAVPSSNFDRSNAESNVTTYKSDKFLIRRPVWILEGLN